MSDFVSCDLARKLKEKGFKFNKDYRLDRFFMGNEVNAPIISQVLKWLREDKKIHVTTGVTPKSSWRYIIMFCDERGLKEPTITEKNHQDYPSAIIAGIEYVLDNLI